MELSIFVAKVISGLYLAGAYYFFSNQVDGKKLLRGFVDNPAFSFVTGFMGLIVSALLVQHHNIWEGPCWVLLITLIGWIGIVKSLVFIAAPKTFLAFESWYSKKYLNYWALLMLLIGLFFGYYGFIA